MRTTTPGVYCFTIMRQQNFISFKMEIKRPVGMFSVKVMVKYIIYLNKYLNLSYTSDETSQAGSNVFVPKKFERQLFHWIDRLLFDRPAALKIIEWKYWNTEIVM